MPNLSEFLYNLKDNKQFLCTVFFIAFATGVYTFYSAETLLCAISFTVIICFLLLIPVVRKGFTSHFIFCLYLLFLSGFLIAKLKYVDEDAFSDINYLKSANLTGVIKTIPKYNSSSNSYKFSFKVERAMIDGVLHEIKDTTVLVSLKNPTKKNKLKFGNRISLEGTLTTPPTATNPSQFDYRKFLNNKGILKTFYARDKFEFISAPDISELFKVKGLHDKAEVLNFVFTRNMHDIRDNVISKHSNYIKSPALEILGGVVFGDDAVNPPDEVKGSFINSGLLHLLAASGLNVAFILSMWLCIVYFVNINYRIKILSGIFIVFLYTVMTGFPPSIVRASVMFVIILLGKLMYKEANGISLVFSAGLLILLFKPEFLCDVGFQLSFLVTLGLTICVPCASRLLEAQNKAYVDKIKNKNSVLRYFLMFFAPMSLFCCVLIPFVAQLWAGPLQAYYFNTFSSYSVLANMAVVPFIGFVSCLGFISTAFCLIPVVSDILLPFVDFILNFVIHIVLNISNYFSSLPNSTIKVPSPTPLMIFFFYLTVIFLFLNLKHFFKKRVLNLCFALSFLILALFFIKPNTNELEVIFFNVGNADNCLIKTPDNKYVMIDTGKYIYNGLSSGNLITLEYLYDNNIKEIDTLIVTHFDADHSGGLLHILDGVKVKNLVTHEPECTSKNACAIQEYIDKNNVKYAPPYSGQTFKYGNNLKITNFVPHTSNFKSRNDSSTVTLLEYNGYKFLFMADAGVLAYKSIEKFLPSKIDVLKVAHHGANKTVDEDMLNKLTPVYSVISTGRNSYKHPNPNTLRLLSAHSFILRTNEQGAIKFKVKDEFEVFSFNSKTKKFKKIDF